MKHTVLLSMLSLSACHWGFRPDPAEGRYRTGEPTTPWKKVPPGSADKAWVNADDSAAIYADSNCGRRYSDESLEGMLDHLTAGIAQGDPIDEQQLRLADREALIRIWQASLDGVSLQLGALILKRNDCIYDVLYIAPEASFERNWAEFERVFQGFQVEGI
jgi:hypothetical protein